MIRLFVSSENQKIMPSNIGICAFSPWTFLNFCIVAINDTVHGDQLGLYP
jgi:hypothetical protein